MKINSNYVANVSDEAVSIAPKSDPKNILAVYKGFKKEVIKYILENEPEENTVGYEMCKKFPDEPIITIITDTVETVYELENDGFITSNKK